MSVRRLMGLVAILLLATIAARAAPDEPQPILIHATAIDVSDDADRVGAEMEVRIERWSTAAERDGLIAAFVDRGQDALVRALKQSPVRGQMRIPDWEGLDPHEYRLGWPLRYAWRIAEPDGSVRIVLATDRHLGFGEERRQPGTAEFPVSFIELRLNPDGEGEGRVSAAGRLKVDRASGVLELEDYSSEPAFLQNVRVER